MKAELKAFFAMALLALSLPSAAALKVFACEPEWGALAGELGGDKVSVYVATTAFQDIHRVDAKPSLIARTRSADLVIASGAELEIGWLPVLIQESGNNKIQPGSAGAGGPFDGRCAPRRQSTPAARPAQYRRCGARPQSTPGKPRRC
jgi:zinc/manganese transport system substrate-binding protein